MLRDPKFLLIGFGERVRNDIYPIIRLFAEQDDLLCYANTCRTEYVNGDCVKIKSICNLKIEKINATYLIMSVPPFMHEQLILNFDFSKFKHVFIDTPIDKISPFRAKCLLNVTILEDVPFSPIVFVVEYLVKKSSASYIYIKNMLFRYHAVSLLKCVTKNKLLEKLDIKYRSKIKIGNITFNKKRNYNAVKIYSFGKWFFKNIDIKINYYGVFSSEDQIYAFSPTEREVSGIAKLIDKEKSLDFFLYIDNMKRIGLYSIFLKALRCETSLYSVNEAYDDYNISDTIGFK